MSKPLNDVSAPFKGNTRSDNGVTDRKSEPVYRCPLCGYKFSWTEGEKACQACFIKNRCTLIMCPRCHHEFPKT
jgi:transposase-like protein